MKHCHLIAVALGLLTTAPHASAQSLWERRDPNFAYLFNDTRARHVGDLLTIVIDESTEFAGNDKTELDHKSKISGSASTNGQYGLGSALVRKFQGTFDGQANAQRSFDGKANNSIDRKLADRMTVVVVAVAPNGNLLVEGRRTRVVSKESRCLVVAGVVRPLDIGPNNTVLSQYIADFHLSYEGRGPESTFANQSWFGRIVNKVWPF